MKNLQKDSWLKKKQITLSFFIFALCACGSGPPPISIEEKKGIASQYPGDTNISEDDRVVFYENFENKSIEDIIEKWGNAKPHENLSLSTSIPPVSKGHHALKIKENGYLYTRFKGLDTLFARFYVKFHRDTGYTHHLVTFIADRDPKPWPKGSAGRRPSGDQSFRVTIEPNGLRGRANPPGIWCFYSKWHEMRGGWGDIFYESFDQIEPDRWYRVEVMIKANSSPDKADGEQAFWIDGNLKGHFRNFRWRTSNELKLNSIWLLYYVTERNMRRNRDYLKDQRVMEIWFDDIVISTNYIGPILRD